MAKETVTKDEIVSAAKSVGASETQIKNFLKSLGVEEDKVHSEATYTIKVSGLTDGKAGERLYAHSMKNVVEEGIRQVWPTFFEGTPEISVTEA